MSFPKRLMVFGFGAFLGALLCIYIIQRRGGFEPRDAPPRTLAEAEAEAVPGIIAAYEERRAPLESSYIVDAFQEPAGEGQYRRVFVLEGRMPGQRLRIEEIQQAASRGLEVVSWRVMAPDRVVMTLKAGLKPFTLKEKLAQWDYRLLRRGKAPDSYIVQLQANDAKAVDVAIKNISGLGEYIVSVTPDFLDRK